MLHSTRPVSNHYQEDCEDLALLIDSEQFCISTKTFGDPDSLRIFPFHNKAPSEIQIISNYKVWRTGEVGPGHEIPYSRPLATFGRLDARYKECTRVGSSESVLSPAAECVLPPRKLDLLFTRQIEYELSKMSTET